MEGQTFQPWGSESFEKVEENLVMSIGEPALIQGHFAELERRWPRVQGEWVQCLHLGSTFLPHLDRLSGVARLLVAALHANAMTPFGTL